MQNLRYRLSNWHEVQSFQCYIYLHCRYIAHKSSCFLQVVLQNRPTEGGKWNDWTTTSSQNSNSVCSFCLIFLPAVKPLNGVLLFYFLSTLTICLHLCFVCVVVPEKIAFSFKTTSLFHAAKIMYTATYKIWSVSSP